MIMKISDPAKTENVVKRAFFLAWQACGGTSGMGMWQDRGPNMTEDQVWDNIQRSGDYPSGGAIENPGRPYADYVFGRMMKLECKFNVVKGEITIPDGSTRRDYQSWSHGQFPTYQSLFDTAAKELGQTGTYL